MGRPKKEHPGAPTEHKGAWRVWWRGRYYDLGPAGSDQAKAEYARLCAVWATDPNATPGRAGEYLVSELFRDYLASGELPASASRRVMYGRVAALLLEHHEATPVEKFGPVALASWQAWLCGLRYEDGPRAGRQRLSRTSVAMFVGIVRGVWKWGVATERIGQEKYAALKAVPGPKKGQARPPKVVTAADPDVAARVLALLRPPARAAIETLIVTGARPSEVLSIRPRDVFRSGVVTLPDAGRMDLDKQGVWVYVPESHKTEDKGKTRWLVLGARARAVLAPWLDRDPDRFCFDPRESMADLRAEQRAGRLSRGGGGGGNHKKPAQAPTHQPQAKYSSGTLRQAVHRACDRLGLPRLGPYQLRHAFAAAVDEAFDIDHVQATLGHADPQVSRRYAKRSLQKAIDVAKRLG